MPRPMGAHLELEIDGITVKCTNVDRVMFPDVGIKKRELLEYYRDIAPTMLPELRGRPLTLERFTGSIDQGGFIQKHVQRHYPDWIDRVELEGKTHVIYPVCNNAAQLVYFANQGSITMHVMNSRDDDPHVPDQIVFDLDPPEGNFEIVRTSARILYDLLGELELPTFVKTSGSKGLHVIVPLDGNSSYDDVAALCRKVCEVVIAQHPDVMTTEFYKKDRRGRLYLDVMRNNFGSTVVAAYSVRARPGAPISAPIGWHELDDPDLAADGFKMRDVLDRLDAWGNPWSELRKKPASVKRAMKQLAKWA
jgi:bifunctional non-homologous end joining protein LigD